MNYSGFFSKKVTPIFGVFLSLNFPKEKYFPRDINFSPSNQFFPTKPIFHTLIQSIITQFRE